MPRPRLDVVVPIYNEHDNLPALFQRLRATFDRLPEVECRVIYVNDGSTDGSLPEMLSQHERDARFTVVELSRNFGHQAALTAGLAAAADADAVVMIDGDLQDPPEVIVELVARWQAGAEVVLAERRSRAESGPRRLATASFYRLLGLSARSLPSPVASGIFGLLDRQALAALNALPERNRFLPGLRSWIGFVPATVEYDREPRAAGAPKQSFWRLVRYAMDGVFSFSYGPLRLMLVAGLIVSSLGFVVACVFIGKRLLGIETAQTGFTTLVSLMLFLGGVQLMAIGLLGEYLGRIYDEVKQRPLYIVRRRHGFDHRAHAP